MTTTLFGISYDANGPATVATFWAATLAREVAPGATAQSASIRPGVDSGAMLRLMFHGVPEGKSVRNRLDLRLISTEFRVDLAGLEALGARSVATFDAWTTLQDPDGNEFDLIRGN